MASDASLEASSSQVAGDNLESTIQINIKTLDSQIHTFRVGKNMLIQNLKERIAETTGVPAGQQRLIFRGRVLKDEHVLSEYHVEDGHTLHLVVKQPTVAHPAPGTSSMEARGSNENNSIGGVPRARIGQVSHGVVLGTVNAAEQNEDLVADIGRLVGTVLGSFGIGGSNISTTLTPPSAPPSVGTNGEPMVGNRTQMGNLGPQGMVNPNHPVQPFAQLSSFPSSVPFSRHMAIPDSLTTLSEFLRRMEQALPYDGSGSQPSPSPTQGSSRPDIPSLNSRGLPTPDMLGSVIQRVRQLLSTNLAMTLARLAERLEREGSSSDLGVRSQIQNEAGHLGVAMQHVGAMLLELGRTMMMLRMGQSPAESFVNAGPAVFISPAGPNPIMVQPFPLQSSSFFGIPPNGNGVSSPLGSVDPSRNINIHIHAGTSVAPGVSSTGARASSGEPVHGESPSLQQTSTNANVLRDSTPRGLPARTIVAAIPARPAAEASGHVLSIIYPVQVRSQQLSVPGHPGSTETSHSNVNNGTEPSMPNPVMQPSSVSDVVPSIVAQINANIAAVLSNSAQAHVSSNSSMQSADSRDPNTGPQLQNVHSTSAPSSGHDHNQSSSSDQSGSDASGFRAFGQAPLGSTSSGLGVETLISQAQSRDNNEASESRCDHTTLQVDDMLGSEQSEGFQVHDRTDPRNLGLDSLSSCSLAGALPSSSSSSQSVVKSTEKNPDSSCSSHSNDMSEGGRPLPLGLGLGGLQPKRRSKPAKPRVTEDASCDMASANQNQGSIATAQQGMQSLVSEGSSTSRENAAGSFFPMAPYISQIMNNLPLGEQGANGQVDMGSMMSSILQSPAFNRLLTGVAEQTGVGSTADLRNMLEQCTQTPAVRNALNQIIEQVDGQSSDAGGLLSGLRRNQGGINLAGMMQQMMPVVSQALGRGLTRSPVSSGIESETATEHADGTSGDDSADKNFQADLHQVVETIEQSDSPADIFRSVLESAARLNGLEDHDLVEELGNDVELANEFVEMLKDLLRESNRRV
ncbi:Ubiquitin-like protein [Dioscorea alata]|uniref:Ubiquitin-like protein n=1 Tax=Dioscorea alata TaxID=55571 RepID=A0ACB7URT3_DIOAL|nr:Ubiquitin-like protein [Dioscorea alata]